MPAIRATRVHNLPAYLRSSINLFYASVSPCYSFRTLLTIVTDAVTGWKVVGPLIAIVMMSWTAFWFAELPA